MKKRCVVLLLIANMFLVMPVSALENLIFEFT